jgi:hypothetical protein
MQCSSGILGRQDRKFPTSAARTPIAVVYLRGLSAGLGASDLGLSAGLGASDLGLSPGLGASGLGACDLGVSAFLELSRRSAATLLTLALIDPPLGHANRTHNAWRRLVRQATSARGVGSVRRSD